MSQDVLFSNARIGVLGGGQLGRMLIQSAIDFNIDLKILDPDPHAPCSNLTGQFVCGKLTDYDGVMDFGKDLDILTIEIENVNAVAMAELERKGVRVFPQPHIVRMIQDKRSQKAFYEEKGIPTAPYRLVEGKADLANHLDFLPAAQKTGEGGYDGRGVQLLHDEQDLGKGLDAPGFLEKLVDIDREISIIIARNVSGQTLAYPPVELVFHTGQNLVDYLIAPADISVEHAQEAEGIAQKIVAELDFVGLLAVEMFLDRSGKILVNEMAPRPHNSGHQTIESNITSQYEQHLRAITNLPLGSTALKSPSAMVNLLGEPGFEGEAFYEGFENIMDMEGVHVHLYGKKITRPFRKMGHVTVTGKDRAELIGKIERVKQECRVISKG